MGAPGLPGRPRGPVEGDIAGPHAKLARSALRGTAWAVASQLTGKLLFFISTIILARLLDQDDFGVAAYALTLITLISAVPGLGLGAALIHFDDSEEMASTGFWLGLGTATACFALLWVVAPFSELIFDDPRAIGVTRTLGLIFPIEALRNVHATLLRKRLAFHRRFVPELLQSIAKGGVAIVLALLGFGYWSLIWGSIAAAAVSVPAYWIVTRWRPRLRVDRKAVSQLLPYGGHIVGVGLLGSVVRNLDYVLVGRMLGAATLGVYVLAFRIPDLLIRNLSVLLGQVLLPVYARVKNDSAAVREAFLAATSYVFAITAPMALGLSLVAEPLVRTAFTEKWIEVVPVIPPICIYALCVSLTFNMGDLYKALGRPDVLTRLALLRAALIVPALWYGAAVVGTATAVAWAQAGVAIIAVAANLVVAGALFEMPIWSVLVRLAPIVGASAAMAAATSMTASVGASRLPLVELLSCALVGSVVYLVALRLMAREFVETGFFTVRDAIARRRPAMEPAQ